MTKKEAVKIVEGSIEDHPEVKEIRRKQRKLEKELNEIFRDEVVREWRVLPAAREEFARRYRAA